jgi:hypothetical protein
MRQLSLGKSTVGLAASLFVFAVFPAYGESSPLETESIEVYRGKVVTIKQRLSGTGPFGSALHNHPSWGIFTITNGDKVKIVQSTLVLNALFGNAKWWDHPVTASRACKKTQDGWENSAECVVGDGDTVSLPASSDFRDYVYEFKWQEGGSVKFWKTEITGRNNLK